MTKEEKQIKVQEFIKLSSQRVFNDNMTDSDIAEMLQISRKTVVEWKKRYANEIASYMAKDMSSLKPQLFKATVDLLGSQKASDRVKGADLFFKLEDKFEAVNNHDYLQVELKRLAVVTRELANIFDLKSKDDIASLGAFIIRLMLESTYLNEKERETFSHANVNDMLSYLDSLDADHNQLLASLDEDDTDADTEE